MSTCIGLGRSMPKFDSPEHMQHIIRHKFIADVFNKDRCAQLNEMFADPSNCVVILASKSFEKAELPLRHKWYNFDYSVEPFNEEIRNILLNPQVNESACKLDLPPKNPLFPKVFDILPEDKTLSERPILLQQWKDQADLWYQKDDQFKRPKGIVTMKMYTSDLAMG